MASPGVGDSPPTGCKCSFQTLRHGLCVSRGRDTSHPLRAFFRQLKAGWLHCRHAATKRHTNFVSSCILEKYHLDAWAGRRRIPWSCSRCRHIGSSHWTRTHWPWNHRCCHSIGAWARHMRRNRWRKRELTAHSGLEPRLAFLPVLLVPQDPQLIRQFRFPSDQVLGP